ncbi:MAG TPA: DUF5069 domain-containing protein [Opitutales bacterium]|nr:DUF5069 domain-containing protein [Opitutales bacterium]
MNHYNYAERLKEVWENAVEKYEQGSRNVSMFFDGMELDFLRDIGTTPAEIYDFAEDFCESKEPSLETFLLVQSVRREYFLEAQGGKFTGVQINVEDLPSKDEAVRDLKWLPRLIGKAKAKLRGEMPSTLMFCCGGDRRFFKTHDIHPAEFLRATWRFENDDEALIDWTVARSQKKL